LTELHVWHCCSCLSGHLSSPFSFVLFWRWI
jgi:hypothetical protein